jgi:PAS domain-containing protein
MNGSHQKSVVLILARELASNIATPTLVLDANGTLIFFNEPAEQVLGATFASTGEIAAGEWDKKWEIVDRTGALISLLDSPLAVCITEQRPAHGELCVTGLDGQHRCVETTVYPLFDSGQQHVGAVGVFWETDGPIEQANGKAPA